MKKRCILFVFAILFCMIICNYSYATTERANNRVQPGDAGTRWVIKSQSVSYTNNGYGWELVYVGQPATQSGEVDSFSYTQENNASITGTFGVTLHDIELSVGFTAGQSYSFTVTKASRALNIGEFIRAYVRRYYQKYTIYQELIKTEVKYRLDENGNPILYLEETVIDTAYAYAYKPLMPQITLSYCYYAK